MSGVRRAEASNMFSFVASISAYCAGSKPVSNELSAELLLLVEGVIACCWGDEWEDDVTLTGVVRWSSNVSLFPLQIDKENRD